jgi:hypothetical protein
VSDCNKNSEKKKLSENSTGTDSENKSQSKENIENQESSNLITNSEFDSSKNNGDILGNEIKFDTLLKNKTKKEKENFPDSQIHQINDSKSESKIIFTTITPETKHSKFSKDLLRIKIYRKMFGII